VGKIVTKLFDEMTFGAYVRFTIEIYLFIVLASISEIDQYENIHKIRSVSLSIAI
jgi:hypothetical protein